MNAQMYGRTNERTNEKKNEGKRSVQSKKEQIDRLSIEGRINERRNNRM